MERYAKGFRSFGGFLTLLHLINFFLPITERTQEGYTALRWSQFEYVKAMIGKSLPLSGEKMIPITDVQTAFILGCMVLPLILALSAGIWGIAGSSRQRSSSILIFIILILYIVLVGFLDILWPEAQATQIYRKWIACPVSIAISGCSTVMAVFALVSTPGKIRKAQQKIPQVQEIKQQQAEAKYSIMMEGAARETASAPAQTAFSPQEQKPAAPGAPRGVMVGLAGIYAGSEIPMTSGEYIKLGRQNTNHLIFEGQTKVSRDHCKIKWDADSKKYSIYDYSTTGSFVNGSHDCLPQNLELFLEPGTVVAIGDDTNTFRLE